MTKQAEQIAHISAEDRMKNCDHRNAVDLLANLNVDTVHPFCPDCSSHYYINTWYSPSEWVALIQEKEPIHA